MANEVKMDKLSFGGTKKKEQIVVSGRASEGMCTLNSSWKLKEIWIFYGEKVGDRILVKRNNICKCTTVGKIYKGFRCWKPQGCKRRCGCRGSFLTAGKTVVTRRRAHLSSQPSPSQDPQVGWENPGLHWGASSFQEWISWPKLTKREHPGVLFTVMSLDPFDSSSLMYVWPMETLDEGHVIFSVPLVPFSNFLLWLNLSPRKLFHPGPSSLPIGSSCLCSLRLQLKPCSLITWLLLLLAMFSPRSHLPEHETPTQEEKGFGLLASSSSNSQLSSSKIKRQRKDRQKFTLKIGRAWSPR